MGEASGPVRLDEAAVWRDLAAGARHEAAEVRELLARARELKGLRGRDLAVLTGISDPGLIGELFEAARAVKEQIYGRRLVLFAPLYVSNLCGNECLYCAFRVRNREVKRRTLTQEEIAREVKHLVEEGHKRLLLVAGEATPSEGFDYVVRCIETIYTTASGHGEIRRVNVNIAPLEVEEFRRLRDARIGTYQLFQETYHRETYGRVHVGGRKADFDWRITAMDRAVTAGIDDVGIGVLFGLFDWRFELLALVQHVEHLERRFGVGPHTISVPRLEPATGSGIALHPPHPVADVDFRKLVAILRLAVPYTGIILSTRETAELRRETFALGVSQISAGSRTNPGGYQIDDGVPAAEQFALGDHRPLDEVVRDVASLGFIPSFCTACYRLGRTGADFMDLARPGEIKAHCGPNAIATFQEYLEDYGSEETRREGQACIARSLDELEPSLQAKTERMIRMVKEDAATSTAEWPAAPEPAKPDAMRAGGTQSPRLPRAVRRERDALGERDLPADVLWGIQTARAAESFSLAGRPVHEELVRAYAVVKLACIETNRALGLLPAPKADALAAACREMAAGLLSASVVVDALQGGAGTSTNMNVNEVLANRALQLMGEAPGRYDLVSPLDDVNRHQSTNDTYPTALKLAAIRRLRALELAVLGLQEAFQAKEKELAHVVKVGRTEMQDAVLTTMGREMGAYAEAFNRDRWRISRCEERLRVVNLGGTAIGTGLGAPRAFIFGVVDRLRELTGIGFARAENLVEATQNADVFVEVSGTLKACAASLLKVCGDLRLLSSGPDAGLGELRLPPRQPGSSIMPGKVNPVIPEAVSQAALLVFAHDQAIAVAAGLGSLELNPFLPLVAHSLLESLDLLERGSRTLANLCVAGLSADEERCRRHVDGSTATVTALVPVLGYEGACALLVEAARTGRTIREAAVEGGLMTAETFAELTGPDAVCRLGSSPPEGVR